MSLRIAFDLDGTLADLDSALDRIAEELFPAALEAEGGKAGGGEKQSWDPPSGGLSAGEKAEGGEKQSWDPPSGGLSTGENARSVESADEALTAEEEGLEPPKVRALTRRQQHAIWDAVRRTTNFWETLDEIEPGIVSRIAAAAEERRWEVIFITQRPAADGDTTQRQSQHWLAQHGFELPSVYVLSTGASRGKVASALSLDIVVDDRPENCLDVKVDSHARAFLVSRDATAAITGNAKRLGIEVVRSIDELLTLLTAAPPQKPTLLGRLKKAIGV